MVTTVTIGTCFWRADTYVVVMSQKVALPIVTSASEAVTAQPTTFGEYDRRDDHDGWAPCFSMTSWRPLPVLGSHSSRTPTARRFGPIRRS